LCTNLKIPPSTRLLAHRASGIPHDSWHFLYSSPTPTITCLLAQDLRHRVWQLQWVVGAWVGCMQDVGLDAGPCTTRSWHRVMGCRATGPILQVCVQHVCVCVCLLCVCVPLVCLMQDGTSGSIDIVLLVERSRSSFSLRK